MEARASARESSSCSAPFLIGASLLHLGQGGLPRKWEEAVPTTRRAFPLRIGHPCVVQRLFSMFPLGAPGVALVILRLAVAATLWTGGAGDCARPPWVSFARPVLAMALCLGMLTPPVAAACAFLHGASLAGCESCCQALPAIVAVANASALAVLGPGAYSVDCRLFGRRVFVVTSGNENSR
jgi:hypothetical protein